MVIRDFCRRRWRRSFQMKKFISTAVIVGMLIISGTSYRSDAAVRIQILTGILNKMESAHKSLKSLKAGMSLTKTNSQIGISDTELGELLYKPATGKGKGKLRIDYVKPSKDIVALVGENVTFYQPRINQVLKSTLAKTSKGKIGGYAQLVGLDSSLKSLVNNYNIEVGKDETINGQAATILKLTPKQASPYSSIDVWIHQSNYLPIQWKIYEKNGDNTVVSLKNMQINASIPDAAFSINIPGGTKVVDKI